MYSIEKIHLITTLLKTHIYEPNTPAIAKQVRDDSIFHPASSQNVPLKLGRNTKRARIIIACSAPRDKTKFIG